jgi:hypothetical protein
MEAPKTPPRSLIVEPYTVGFKEALAYTGLSKSSLNRAVQAGRLERLHFGRKPLFRLNDLRRLVDKKGKATDGCG